MRCTNCGRDHALQNATEVAVASNGAPTVLRCSLCSTERRAKPEHRAYIDRVEEIHYDASVSLEEARARTAVLQAEMTRLI